jgi:dTDP-4-dehydrorhamnose reductase
MLGHKLWQTMRPIATTYVTVRQAVAKYTSLGLFDNERIIDRVDVRNDGDVERVLDIVRPDIVINAVGIIKQLKEANNPIVSIEINSLLPHRLTRMCAARSARLIHISTDCVFSGRRGGYTEADEPDPIDLYGRTKLLGEVDGENATTLRTSMIGREVETSAGLVEWFLANRGGHVRGYAKAIYTGFTTLELSRIVADIALKRPDLHGLWQVSSDPISKLELLRLINDRLDLHVDIQPDNSFFCDRSLDSRRYREAAGYRPPTWRSMIDEMCSDDTPYNTWKQQ